MAVSNVELRVGATQAITALKNVNTQAQKFNQTVNGTNSKLKDANKTLPILGKSFFGDPRLKSALDNYIKDTNEFKKELKRLGYGNTNDLKKALKAQGKELPNL